MLDDVLNRILYACGMFTLIVAVVFTVLVASEYVIANDRTSVRTCMSLVNDLESCYKVVK